MDEVVACLTAGAYHVCIVLQTWLEEDCCIWMTLSSHSAALQCRKAQNVSSCNFKRKRRLQWTSIQFKEGPIMTIIPSCISTLLPDMHTVRCKTLARHCCALFLDSGPTLKSACKLKISQRGFSLPRSRCIIHSIGTNRRRQQQPLLHSPTLLGLANNTAQAPYFYVKSRLGREM